MPTLRGRRSAAFDLKDPREHADLLRLVAVADVLIEGYRPGVTERLGVGPAECQARNPRLVYGRMTGWGQDGPLAQRGRATTSTTSPSPARCTRSAGAGEPPVPPLNLVGDFGGGSMLLVGRHPRRPVRAPALRRRARSSTPRWSTARALLTQMLWSWRSVGAWSRRARGQPARRRRAVLRHLRLRRRQATSRSARSSRSSTRPCSPASAGHRTPGSDHRDRAGWPALRARFTAAFAEPHPRRVGRAVSPAPTPA